MTYLLASICVTLFVRSISWYLAIVFCHDGWRRRHYYRAAQALPHDYIDDPHPSRKALRDVTQTHLTALGESFSKWISGGDRTKGGIPSRTNPYVNAIATICVLLGANTSVLLAIVAGRAFTQGDYQTAMVEVGIAAAAVVGGLVAARALSLIIGDHKKRTAGVVAILCAGLFGALGAALLLRSFLCTPQLSLRRVAGMIRGLK
ncbi:MAG TPA: hypothetical protein VGQ36_14995 [Thermoanaerobaculia bacterium]|nr:hypothetical protein [Thermoanaerobaculia bacterium]